MRNREAFDFFAAGFDAAAFGVVVEVDFAEGVFEAFFAAPLACTFLLIFSTAVFIVFFATVFFAVDFVPVFAEVLDAVFAVFFDALAEAFAVLADAFAEVFAADFVAAFTACLAPVFADLSAVFFGFTGDFAFAADFIDFFEVVVFAIFIYYSTQ